jgi:hypothetical protein
MVPNGMWTSPCHIRSEVFTAVTTVTSGMLHRVALVRPDVSEERSVSFFRVTRICELGTTLAVTHQNILNATTYVMYEEAVVCMPHR